MLDSFGEDLHGVSHFFLRDDERGDESGWVGVSVHMYIYTNNTQEESMMGSKRKGDQKNTHLIVSKQLVVNSMTFLLKQIS